ncbi:unnamed protein product [Symbiodinium sp. KB8]|nr:unnamed protein product [Symbiodinium sp. KB8]
MNHGLMEPTRTPLSCCQSCHLPRLTRCLSGWDRLQEITSDPNRWRAPRASDSTLPEVSNVNQTYAHLSGKRSTTVKSAWASCVNMSLNHRLSSSDDAHAHPIVVLAFGKREHAQSRPQSKFDFFVVCEKVRTTLRLAVCTPLQGQQAAVAGGSTGVRGARVDGRQIQVASPLIIVNSHDIIARYYDAVVAKDLVNVFVVPVMKVGDGGRISVIHLGSPATLLTLQPPSQRFCKKIDKIDAQPQSKQDKVSKPACTGSGQHEDQGRRDIDIGSDVDEDDEDLGDDSANDVAQEGLNLLLEQHEAENDTDAATGEAGEDDITRTTDLIDTILTHDIDVYQDELASCEADLCDSFAAEAEEAQSQRLEDNITRAVLSRQTTTAASSSAGPTSAPCVAARSVMDAFESNMGQLSMDECVQEAILTDRRVLGNDHGVLSMDGGLTHAFLAWREELARSAESLSASMTSSFDGSVSLVLLKDCEHSEARVVLIQWTDAGVAGRVADMDEEHCLKTIVPAGIKRHPIDITLPRFSGSLVIMKGTGVFMQRFKRGTRPSVPQRVLRLRDMVELASSRVQGDDHDDGDHASLDTCRYCASNLRLWDTEAGSHIAPGACCICHVVAHPCCSRALLPQLESCLADFSAGTEITAVRGMLASDLVTSWRSNARTSDQCGLCRSCVTPSPRLMTHDMPLRAVEMLT